MKSPSLLLAGALMALASRAALASPLRFQGYTFDASVIKSNGMRYREFPKNGQMTINVQPEEEYSIVVRNPLPVRVAVAVTIDGLNSIDGKRSSPKNAKKWMIDPNSSITIEGWQTSGQTLRKFVFTRQDSSYAQWQENRSGKPFSRNLGVIGVAWFWNSRELDMALHPPQPFDDGQTYTKRSDQPRSKSAAPAAAGASAEGRAGTGMGRQEHNAVTEIEFNANAGMFSVRDVLKIFYEFAKEPSEPMPFVDESDDSGRFAPEMTR